MLNYEIDLSVLRKYLGTADYEATMMLYENANHDTNVISTLRDFAQKKVGNGQKRYQHILNMLDR